LTEDVKIAPPVCIKIDDSGLTAYVAIDTLINGRSCGGLRMVRGVTPEEMIGLARAMTLKYGFLGLPHGGAKAGIVFDETAGTAEKARLLDAFARKAGWLLKSRAYAPGADMGTTNADIRGMLKRAGVDVPKRTLRSERSGFYTAATVLAALERAAKIIGLTLGNATAAIEGFGSVGMPLAEGLKRLGVKVVAVSTSRGAIYSARGLDVENLVKSAKAHASAVVERFHDAERIELDQLLELPVDILLPCARHDGINSRNAARIKAKIICPGANNPITAEADKILHERGVLSVPDFIANSGGVLGGTMEFAGLEEPEITDFMGRYFSRQVDDILKRARSAGTTPAEVATGLSTERFQMMEREARSASARSKLFAAAHGLYRRGLVPGFLVRGPALEYFRRRIEGRF
jgi:glutamate dehydrogenase (NAD(P)+)